MGDERGSIVLPMLGICMGMVIVTLFAFTLFASFLARRMGQTAADSAALAAIGALEEGLPGAFAAALEPKVRSFWASVAAEVGQAERSPEAESDQIWDAACSRDQADLGKRLCDYKRGRTQEYPALLDLVGGFLTPQERGAVILSPAANVERRMQEAANEFSRGNGGPNVTLCYPYGNGPVVHVVLQQPVRYLVIDRGLLPEEFAGMRVTAAVGLPGAYSRWGAEYPQEPGAC